MLKIQGLGEFKAENPRVRGIQGRQGRFGGDFACFWVIFGKNCVHACVHVYVHACMHACIFVCMYIYAHKS